jgi:menaquinol-cytochrome c reductase iron-sulfur subunit
MDDDADRVDPAPGDVPPVDHDGPADPERRRFLIGTISVIGAGITAAIGVPAIVFVTGPTRADTGEDTWIRLGAASSVDPGAPPTLMKAVVTRRSGYREEEQEVSVFVTTEDGRDFLVLSNVCTHLGCRVRWVDDQDGFFCPCHNAVFGPDGGVVSGPPPRPLDRFESTVEEGQILFKFREV